MRWIYALAFLLLVGCSTPTTNVAPDGFEPIFDGVTLDGWHCPEPGFWSVRDGAITGEVRADHLPDQNQFLVYQGEPVADFELEFEFRMVGEQANSGMQLRGTVDELHRVHGYQADIGPGRILGGIWDEYGTRRALAPRGKRVVIGEDGRRTTTDLVEASAPDPGNGVDLAKWNSYRIVARGPQITLWLNGQKCAELVDRERGKASASGVLAMPVVPREMTVQYRDLRLRRL